MVHDLVALLEGLGPICHELWPGMTVAVDEVRRKLGEPGLAAAALPSNLGAIQVELRHVHATRRQRVRLDLVCLRSHGDYFLSLVLRSPIGTARDKPLAARLELARQAAYGSFPGAKLCHDESLRPAWYAQKTLLLRRYVISMDGLVSHAVSTQPAELGAAVYQVAGLADHLEAVFYDNKDSNEDFSDGY